MVTVLDTTNPKYYVMVLWAVYVTMLSWNMTKLKEEVTALLCFLSNHYITISGLVMK